MLLRVNYKNFIINTAFIGAIGILFAVLVLVNAGFKSLTQQNTQIVHSNETMQTMNVLLYEMMDVERSVTNYLLTSDEIYSQNLAAKLDDLDAQAHHLDNVSEYAAGELPNLISSQIAAIKRIVQLKANGTLLPTDVTMFVHDMQIISDKMDPTLIDIAHTLRFSPAGKDDVFAKSYLRIVIDVAGILGIALLLLMTLMANANLLKLEQLKLKLKNLDSVSENIHELQEKNEKIALLLEMSDIMLASENIKELSNIIAKYCGKLFNFSSGIFYVMPSSKNYLESMASWGELRSHEEHFPVERCWSIRLGHIYSANSADAELVCEHVKKHTQDDKANFSYVCIPLQARNDVYGLLYIEMVNKNVNENILSPNERLLVNCFAELAALAVANVRLRDGLQYQSTRDHLTALHNRRCLEEFLTKLILQSERTKISSAIALVDVDNFKIINDKFGHYAGDLALKELAVVLSNNIRSGDLASRYGGEEFILVLHDVDEKVAMLRAEKIRQAVGLIRIKYGVQDIISFTCSIGLAIYPRDGASVSSLIDTADRALYLAKNSGKNKVVMLPDIKDTIEKIAE